MTGSDSELTLLLVVWHSIENNKKQSKRLYAWLILLKITHVIGVRSFFCFFLDFEFRFFFLFF